VVHSVHAPQLDTTQSTAQAWVLQSLVSCFRFEHGKPPCKADTTTDRLRVWVPVPQVLEHCDFADQNDSSQCTGQAMPALQTFSWTPVQCALSLVLTTVALRVVVPPPQVLEQADHVCQEPNSQVIIEVNGALMRSARWAMRGFLAIAACKSLMNCQLSRISLMLSNCFSETLTKASPTMYLSSAFAMRRLAAEFALVNVILQSSGGT
jgi:hypothetical protein